MPSSTPFPPSESDGSAVHRGVPRQERSAAPEPTAAPGDFVESEFLDDEADLLPDAKTAANSNRIVAVVGVACFGMLAAAVFFLVQREAAIQKERLNREDALRTKLAVLPVEAERRLDQALKNMGEGGNLFAIQTLEDILQNNPLCADLKFYLAQALFNIGENARALSLLDECEAMGIHLASVRSLKAAILASEYATAEEARKRQLDVEIKRLLERAVSEDRFSATARQELASYLRARGERAEARRLLEAARARLGVVDSLTSVDVQLALMDAEDTPSTIPVPRDGDGPDVFFAAAYGALRRGNDALAGKYLKQAAAMLPATTFRYLSNDPSLRRLSVSAPGSAAASP